ncbi:MAG: hypothetical protein Q7K34_04415, partial [archaeon]|nr:hypothetical protein [archaeon]
NNDWMAEFNIESDTGPGSDWGMWVAGERWRGFVGRAFPASDGTTGYSAFVKEINADSVVLVYAKSEYSIWHDISNGVYTISTNDYDESKYPYKNKILNLKVGETFAEQYTLNGLVKKVWITLKKSIGPPADKCSEENIAKSKGVKNLHCLVGEIYLQIATQVGEKPKKEFEVFMQDSDDPYFRVFGEDEYYFSFGKNNSEDADFLITTLKEVNPEPINNSAKPSIQNENAEELEVEKEYGPMEIVATQESGEKLIKQESTTTRTNLEVEVTEDKLFVKNAAEKKQLKITPQKAKEAITAKEKINCENLELAEKQGSLAYTCKTKQTGKLFGLFPMEFEVTAEISAEQEAEVTVNRPWWSFMVFK